PLTAAGEARRAVLADSVLGLILEPAAKWAELTFRLQELQRYDNEEEQTRIAWQRLLTGVPPSARCAFARFQLTEGQLSMANGLDSIVIRLRAEADLLRAELANQLELRNQRLRNLARLGGELGAVLDTQPTSEPSSKPSAPPAWFAEEYRMLVELLAQVDCDRESEFRLEQFESALRGEVARRVRTAASSDGEGEGDAAILPFARSMSDPWPVFAELLQRDAFDEFRVAAEELTQVATAAREISLQIGAHYSLLEGLLELEDLRRDWDVEPELAAYAATLAEFMAETRQLGEVVRDAARRRRFAEVVDALKSRFGRQRPGNLRTALTNLFIDKNRCLEGVKVAGASSPGPVTSQAKIPDVLDWLRNKLWPNFEQLDAAVRVELTNGGLQPPRRLAVRSREERA
ncbi:MAG TPA: hypothetical protein PLV92_18550, partial [Pirellulaceae bacterium]|nr:hypothetical protein [Pirellulaceae bacterium]